MANSKKRVKQHKKARTVRKSPISVKRKLISLYIGVTVILMGLLGKITFINATQGKQYKKNVLSQAQQRYGSTVLPAQRGDILDRNGNILATSNKVYNVILDCKVVNADSEYMEPTVRALKENFGLEEEEIRSVLTAESTKESQYQVVKKKVSMSEKKEFETYSTITEDDTPEQKKEKQNIQGIWFEEDYLRVYPFNELACDTIGFTLSRDVADSGLEGYYNSTLVGNDGRRYASFNTDSLVEQTIVEARNGRSLVTTLDVGAQQIVEKYVNAFNEKMGAKHVGVIVMTPSNGEIIAMDGGDRYDLNNARDLSNVYSEAEIKAMSDTETVDALNAMWQNFCVTDAYEPGSVVKPIVVGAALEAGNIDEEDKFYCDGFQNFGVEGNMTMIKCAAYPDAHGDETLANVIANSCNDGMMQIASVMGKEPFIESQSLFNFGSRTGIDLPNEGSGIIHNASTMGITELACSAFGQGFTCTMLQEIAAMCSVINGGYYYQPHLVKQIIESNGTVKNYPPVLMKQTVSQHISELVRTYMKASVDEGTSQTSKVQGYSSGGKTGTAEKLPRGNGKYLVSFIGFAPVEEPEVLIYVVVDEPDAEDQATSTYAQFIAQGILSELLPYMNVPMDEITGDYIPETELWEGFDGLIKTEDEIIQEAISNEDAPEPLPEEEGTLEGNDMETEGLTNEEAGLE